MSATVFVVTEPHGPGGIELETRRGKLEVRTFPSAEDFLANRPETEAGIVVAQARMSGMGGLGLARELSLRKIDLPIILVADRGDVAAAVESVRVGAVDFLEKPVSSCELRWHVEKALRRCLARQREAPCDTIRVVGS